MDRLDCVSILLAVAEDESLSAGARRLNTPLATVSRKISDLEAYLKAQLLTRSSRRLTLTDASKSYVVDAGRAGHARHDCVGVQGFTGPSFWSVAGNADVPVRYRMIVNSTDAAYDAAKAGMGIVSVFSHRVTSAFQDGSLAPVLPDFERRTLPLSLTRTLRGYPALKLRAFLDDATPRLKARLAAAQNEFLAVTEKADRR
jgi:DNA-binding transcriptional LysR family regulator